MKDFWISILKMIVTIIVIFTIPFILPLILKLFIKVNIFSDIEEFNSIIQIFFNIYPITYIMVGIILLLWFFHKWQDIKDLFSRLEYSIDLDKKKFSAKVKEEELEKISKQNEFMKEITKDNKPIDSDNTKIEIKQELGILNKEKNKALKCKECNKKELEEENEKLRNFAAYNVVNSDVKTLLHVIYNDRYIETDKFKDKIIIGYKKRNKRNVKISHRDINEIAKKRYETIFEGLKFLNIIEPSEDDKEIKLTVEGKKFVEKYIEKEVV